MTLIIFGQIIGELNIAKLLILTWRINKNNSDKSKKYKSTKKAEADCVVFTTNHSCFDAKLIVDMRNVVKSVAIENGKVFKL